MTNHRDCIRTGKNTDHPNGATLTTSDHRAPLPRDARLILGIALLISLGVSHLVFVPQLRGIAKQRESERLAAEKVARAQGGVATR